MIVSSDGKRGLLASAPTKDALEKAINEYFFSNGGMSITDDGNIYSAKKEKTLSGYKAYKKGQRWRFEIIYS